MKRVLTCLLFFLSVAMIHPCLAADEVHPLENSDKHPLLTKPNPDLPTLYLIGDSTMKVETTGQRGWGEELAPFFDLKKINVVNQAIGGRSSRTYQTEGRWDAALAKMQKGDFAIIQFGHNDGGAINDNSRARASLKGIGDETQEIDNILTKKHEIVHTYGWYMKKYVEDVKAKGATPIVFSLVPRNSWKDGKVVRASGNNYGGWSRQIADADQVTFVDHNEIIAEGLDKLGPEKTLPLFADQKLHASPEGAVFNAKAAVAGLRAIEGKPFEQYLSKAGLEIPAFAPAK